MKSVWGLQPHINEVKGLNWYWLIPAQEYAKLATRLICLPFSHDLEAIDYSNKICILTNIGSLFPYAAPEISALFGRLPWTCQTFQAHPAVLVPSVYKL